MLLIVIALVVYASLYPFDFVARDSLAGLLHRWPRTLDRFALRDIGINLLAYLPVGWFAFLTLAKNTRRLTAIVYAAELGTGLSVAMEVVQYFERTRMSSSLDVLLNAAGTVLGAAAAALFGGAALRATRRSGITWSAPVALLAAWAAYLVFPPVPAIGFAKLANRWQALMASGSPALLATATGAVYWLIAARLIEASGFRYVRAALFAVMTLVPARLVLAGRPLTSSAIAAAAIGFAVWLAVGHVRSRGAVIAALAITAVAASGFAPFHFGGPNVFAWLPFQGSLGAERADAVPVLLEKVFIYGSTLWLMRDAGWPRRLPAGGFVLLLAAIEAVQVYLPGRTPEITDPLLGALLAFALARVGTAREEPAAAE